MEDAWTQFQNYLNGSENIDSQVIMEFLNFSWQTKNMAVGSMVNLKVRLSLAYKKYTGWRKYDFGIQTYYSKTLQITASKVTNLAK